jgi:hypothetical protein
MTKTSNCFLSISKVLEELESSPFDFQLTGSCREGSLRDMTPDDLDFFVENSEEVSKFLEGLGFDSAEDYKSKIPRGQRSVESVMFHKAGIHVQLIHPEWLDWKKSTAAFFDKLRAVTNLRKRLRAYMWIALEKQEYENRNKRG